MTSVSTTNNIINSNKRHPSFSKLAINVLNSLEDKAIFAYEGYSYGDLDEFGTETEYSYYFYLITLDKNGYIKYRVFSKNFIQTYDDNGKENIVDLTYDEEPMNNRKIKCFIDLLIETDYIKKFVFLKASPNNVFI